MTKQEDWHQAYVPYMTICDRMSTPGKNKTPEFDLDKKGFVTKHAISEEVFNQVFYFLVFGLVVGETANLTS